MFCKRTLAALALVASIIAAPAVAQQTRGTTQILPRSGASFGAGPSVSFMGFTRGSVTTSPASFTVKGARVNDLVFVQFENMNNLTPINGAVTADNTVQLRFLTQSPAANVVIMVVGVDVPEITAAATPLPAPPVDASSLGGMGQGDFLHAATPTIATDPLEFENTAELSNPDAFTFNFLLGTAAVDDEPTAFNIRTPADTPDGQLQWLAFQTENSDDEYTTYSYIRSQAVTATAGAEVGGLYLGTKHGGVVTDALVVSGGNTYALGALSVGGLGNTAIQDILTNTQSLNFGSTAAGDVSDLTVTVTGAALQDTVMLGVPNGSVPDKGSFSAWVSATNTVTVRFSNNDLVAAKDPAMGNFAVTVFHY